MNAHFYYVPINFRPFKLHLSRLELEICACMHMICFKLGRLIKHGLGRTQSRVALHHGKKPSLKYRLAITKL